MNASTPAAAAVTPSSSPFKPLRRVPPRRLGNANSTVSSGVSETSSALAHAPTPRGAHTVAAAGSKGGGSASGLLSGVHPESVEACTRIIARAQAASDTWSVDFTGFLDPALAEARVQGLEFRG